MGFLQNIRAFNSQTILVLFAGVSIVEKYLKNNNNNKKNLKVPCFYCAALCHKCAHLGSCNND